MDFIGIDWGGKDATSIVWFNIGATYICTLPAEFGSVTDLRETKGRVIAETESGISFIVPLVIREGE